jgi:hypothetical protein
MPKSFNQVYAETMERLYRVVGRIYGWGELAIETTPLEGEQEAAYLLRNAGVLILALRTLDNRWHETMAELRLFDSDWPTERREHVISRVNNFAGQEAILPVVRHSVAELEAALESPKSEDLGLPDFQEQLRELVACGRTILAAVGESPVTPFKDTTELTRFLDNIKRAKTAEEVESVRHDLENALGVLDRRILASADKAFGELRFGVLRRYPSLPDPGWVTDIDNMRPGM